MSIKIEMPHLSDTISKITVSRLLKKEGDFLEEGDHLADLQTEYARLEVLVSDRGRLMQLGVQEGEHITAGTQLALLDGEFFGAGEEDFGVCRMSPLAAAMAADLKLDCREVVGSGPQGKIMAADIKKLAATARANDLPIAKKASVKQRVSPVVVKMDGYYVYAFPADMSQLAAISIPIAVQCEKLMGGRYSLFDYVARVSVKACLSRSGWLVDPVDLSMVLDKGEREIVVHQASSRTIYHIARTRMGMALDDNTTILPAESAIVLSDAGLPMPELRRRLASARLNALVALGGTRPKTGFEAGKPVNKLMLPVTMYLNASCLSQKEAVGIAAEFKTLLENPVLMLF